MNPQASYIENDIRFKIHLLIRNIEIPGIKLEVLALLKESNEWDAFVIFKLAWLFVSLENAYQQVQLYWPPTHLINHLAQS